MPRERRNKNIDDARRHALVGLPFTGSTYEPSCVRITANQLQSLIHEQFLDETDQIGPQDGPSAADWHKMLSMNARSKLEIQLFSQAQTKPYWRSPSLDIRFIEFQCDGPLLPGEIANFRHLLRALGDRWPFPWEYDETTELSADNFRLRVATTAYAHWNED